MNKIASLGFVILFCFFCISCQKTENVTKVGIIIPLEHKALDEIVAGFTETLQKLSTHHIKFKVANAQGDINLQRAFIAQMKDEQYDLIVPISTVTTQMTAAMVHEQPILSLAATYPDAARKQKKMCNIAIVHDEIAPEKLVDFFHQTYPTISNVVLVHSPSDKIFPQVKASVLAGKKIGLAIKPVMVPTLNELYATASLLPPRTQGILVLKDSLIASGIDTLELTAKKRKIPLMSADQGSVEDGAGFSLGVLEKEIGVMGAKLADRILNGQPPCGLAPVEMQDLSVFINRKSLEQEQQSLEPILTQANANHYKIVFVNEAT